MRSAFDVGFVIGALMTKYMQVKLAAAMKRAAGGPVSIPDHEACAYLEGALDALKWALGQGVAPRGASGVGLLEAVAALPDGQQIVEGETVESNSPPLYAAPGLIDGKIVEVSLVKQHADPHVPPIDESVYSRPECPFNYCDDPPTCKPAGQCHHTRGSV